MDTAPSQTFQFLTERRMGDGMCTLSLKDRFLGLKSIWTRNILTDMEIRIELKGGEKDGIKITWCVKRKNKGFENNGMTTAKNIFIQK